MKRLIVIPVVLLLLAGCSVSTPYIDKEFGQASRQSLEMQIANPDYRYAGHTPDGIAGLTAEGIMEVYTNDFDKTPTDIDVFQLGIEDE